MSAVQMVVERLAPVATIFNFPLDGGKCGVGVRYLEIEAYAEGRTAEEARKLALTDLAWKLMQVDAQLTEVLGPRIDPSKTQVLPIVK